MIIKTIIFVVMIIEGMMVCAAKSLHSKGLLAAASNRTLVCCRPSGRPARSARPDKGSAVYRHWLGSLGHLKPESATRLKTRAITRQPVRTTPQNSVQDPNEA
jgi:hypothetical protein